MNTDTVFGGCSLLSHYTKVPLDLAGFTERKEACGSVIVEERERERDTHTHTQHRHCKFPIVLLQSTQESEPVSGEESTHFDYYYLYIKKKEKFQLQSHEL